MISSLFLGSAALSLTGLLASPAAAQSGSTYTLDTEYSGSTFFDGFDFYTGADPTNGFVTYVNETEAETRSLISSADGSPAIMSVDDTTVLTANGSEGGRASVRITSQKSWTHGLFIADLNHMPGGICGTWPAFWTLGPDWPNYGEIDIIEGVNDATNNLMSLHTSANCTIAGADQTGTLQTDNCDTAVDDNSGCGVTADTTESYGTGFNNVDGGIYAMQWTSDYIRIWFFASGSVPSDITDGSPDPSGWGEPAANMEGSCDIDTHFADHQIIFDTTFCGDYGNAVWSSDTACSALASTCDAYVAANPSAFTDAYWSVNSVKVYQLVASNSTSTTSSSAASSASSSSLSSATPSSSVLAPGMGNTTTASTSSATTPYAISTPSASSTTSGNPAEISGYEYYGCYGSSMNFTSFSLVANSSSMSNDECVAACQGSSYAGTYMTQCYCGSSIGASAGLLTGTCNIPCPGDASETCGGNVTTSAKMRRAVPNNILLTLYALIVGGTSSSSAAAVSSSAAPTSTITVASVGSTAASGYGTTTGLLGSVTAVHYVVNGSSTASTPLSSVSPASATIGYGMGGQVTGTVLTTTYVDVCPTGLTTVTLTSTIAQCGCTNTAGRVAGVATTTSAASPTITMTTTVKECTACAATGGPSSVTITVPASVLAATASASASAAANTSATASFSSQAAVTTIAGQATTVTYGVNEATIATSAAVAGVLASNYTSASNGTVATASVNPSMNVFTGQGETLAASGYLCVAMLMAVMVL